jgi:beta-lactamase regulating signal transducer with metallopeptidase domain
MTSLELFAGLADWTIKATIIVLVAWSLAWLFRRDASTRRLVWLAAFAAILATPILSTLRHNGSEVLLPLSPGASTSAPTGGIHGRHETAATPGFLLTVWAAGACLLIGNGLVGFVALRRVLKQSSVWTPENIDLDELSKAAQVRRWRLIRLQQDVPVTAMTWGWIKPVVLLARSAEAWDSTRLRLVLLHELAHVRRADSLFQVLVRLTCCVMWFNPLLWLAAGALRASSEELADQSVLEAGVKPTDYATALLATAHELQGRRRVPTLAGVPLLRATGLEQRIASLIRTDAKKANRRGHTAMALGALLVASLTLATFRATAAPPTKPFSNEGMYSKEFWEGYRAGLNYSRNNRQERGLHNRRTPSAEAARNREIELMEIEKLRTSRSP